VLNKRQHFGAVAIHSVSILSSACLDAMVPFRRPIQMAISCHSKKNLNGMAVWHNKYQPFRFKTQVEILGVKIFHK